jgi:hypothetical protein
MVRKKVKNNIDTKKSFDDHVHRKNEVLKVCPYEEKKCFECEIQSCPEERV